jgi:hypothetical protein
MPKSSEKENPKKDNSGKNKRVAISETIEEIKKEKKKI